MTALTMSATAVPNAPPRPSIVVQLFSSSNDILITTNPRRPGWGAATRKPGVDAAAAGIGHDGALGWRPGGRSHNASRRPGGSRGRPLGFRVPRGDGVAPCTGLCRPPRPGRLAVHRAVTVRDARDGRSCMFLSTRLEPSAMVMVVKTKTSRSRAAAGYDPSSFPAFAVTVDMVVLTMSGGRLHVLLVRRGVAPFQGAWAIPGGFKRPTETLDEAARRELAEETGVDTASLLTQFGSYGDPGRDPRMNVVTVAYLAVLRDVGKIVAGTDAADAALIPISEALSGTFDLAFDHARIVRDALERVRVDLEQTGIATAFVGPTFTVAE